MPATSSAPSSSPGWRSSASARSLRAQAALEARADAAERAGDHAAALAHARELLARERLSEAAHRRVIRLLYLQGDRAAALLAFDRCEQLLKDEVGAKPSAETLALLATINAAATPDAPAPGRRLPASVLLPPRLVGRDAAWRALHDAWDAGHSAVVTGEGGMGKSRLIGDFARARGRTLVVGARPGDERVVYASLSRLLRALPADALRSLAAPVRATLAWLLPELGEPASSPDTSEGRARFFNAVSAALDAESLAIEGIAFDDLHFADAASIELLQYAMGASTRRWILTARDAEVSAPGRLLLDETLAQREAVAVPLEPLTLAHVSEIVDSLGIASLRGGDDRGDAAAPLRRQSAVPARDAEGLARSRRCRHGRRRERRRRSLAAGTAADRGQPELGHRAAHRPALGRRRPAGALRGGRGARLLDRARLARARRAHARPRRPVRRARGGAGAARRRLRARPDLRGGAGVGAGDRSRASFMPRSPPSCSSATASRRGWRTTGCRPATRRRPAAPSTPQRNDRARRRRSPPSARCWPRRRAASSWPAGRPSASMPCSGARERWRRMTPAPTRRAAVEAVEALATSDEQRLLALDARLELTVTRGELHESLRLGDQALAAARALGRPDLELRFAITTSGALLDARRADEAVLLLEPLEPFVRANADPEPQWEYWAAHALALDYANRLGDAMSAWEAARAVAQQARTGATCCGRRWPTARRRKPRWAWSSRRPSSPSKRTRSPARRTRPSACACCRCRSRSPTACATSVATGARSTCSTRRSPATRASGASHSDFALAEQRLVVLYQQLGQPARALPLLAPDRPGVPRGVAMIRLAHRAELEAQMGRDGLALMREALQIIPNADDIFHRIVTLFATRLVPADEGEALAANLALWATTRERHGVALSGHVRAAACALALGAPARALPHVEAARRLATRYLPDSFYLPELWLVSAQTFATLGREPAARRAAADGQAWVREVHDKHVPAEFRDSFLHRNAINRELIALPGSK